MLDWEFRDPWFLLLLLLAPLVYYLMTRRSTSSVTFSTLALLDLAPRSFRARFVNFPSVLLALAVAAMAVAMAGPRRPDEETRVRREGIAIAMVVDRSGSMQARDLVKNDISIDRLQAVKALFKQFVLGAAVDEEIRANIGRGRPDDVIGLIAFARYADALCPLTLDHGNLINILDDVEIVTEQTEDGTALGEGLALAVERLRQHTARSKVAILLTDGVNNAGDISPEQAAELAQAHDVKVYCIGAGTRGMAPVPGRNPLTGQIVLQRMRVQIDEATLESIAQKTGGRYFRATDAKGLADVYKQIDELERTEIAELRFLQYDERYGLFAAGALGLIAAGGLLSQSLFRRLP